MKLADLINLMLNGSVNDATDVLYGANLCTLRKRNGGIRLIAVRCITTGVQQQKYVVGYGIWFYMAVLQVPIKIIV